jgi:hypothetical protein
MRRPIVAKKSKVNQTWNCSGLPDNYHVPFDNFGPDCCVCGARREDIIGVGKAPGSGTSGGANKIWNCSGLPDNPHDPFDNFGPDCSVCGSKREEIIIGGSGKESGGGILGIDGKFPVLPIASGCAIGLLVLSGSWLASPQIGGLCDIANNCALWEQDLSKAQKLTSESKAITDKKDSSKVELESARNNISRAIRLLNPLRQKSSVKAKATIVLAEAQSIHNELDQKVAVLNKSNSERPATSPIIEPGSTHEIIKAAEPNYIPLEPAAEAPRDKLPVDRQSLGAPPRDEQLIPN